MSSFPKIIFAHKFSLITNNLFFKILGFNSFFQKNMFQEHSYYFISCFITIKNYNYSRVQRFSIILNQIMPTNLVYDEIVNLFCPTYTQYKNNYSYFLYFCQKMYPFVPKTGVLIQNHSVFSLQNSTPMTLYSMIFFRYIT